MRYLLGLLAFTLCVHAQTAPKRPKLVVALTIDQFRADYLLRFRDQYSGGLARLLNQGAVFTQAYYEHFPTVTAIGHSTFLTGATPSVSGIIGNEWFERRENKQVTSVSDDNELTLGGASRGNAKSASPRRLLVSTLGDELKMAGRGSKVVGISVKDRSAILPAGHMADGAYWFDPTTGNFASSTYYFKDLPAWVKDFNQSRFADKFAGAEWKSLDGSKTFKKMPEKPDNKYFSALESAPYGNDIVEKFAEAAIAGEQLGKRDTTDVLAISFSANDYVGHQMGPDSAEVRDVSLRTDRLLADFFRYLDAQVGMRNVLVVLTADHGVSPVPEVNRDRRMPGGRITEKDVAAKIEEALVARYGQGPWLIGKSGASQYLNTGLIAARKLSYTEVAEYAASTARQLPEIFRVYTREQLAKGAVPGDLFDKRILNGFFHDRAYDLTIVAKPYHVFEGGKGTSHGMPFSYDAHIPVIFMGEGIRPGKYHQKITANDIAPTLAAFLEVETPSGAVGRTLHEIFVPVAPGAAPAKKPAAAKTAP